MSEIIAPSVAARLRFFVTDPTTGVGVTGLTHSTITTAGYATETNGVRSSTTSVTLTSTAAATAALATGQLVEYGLGQYGIDVPAVGTSGLIFAVVTVTGKDVRAVAYRIDVAVSTRNATSPDNVGIAAAKEAAEAVEAKLPTTSHLAGAATDEGYAVLDSVTQQQIVNSVLTTVLTESYAADGASPTLTQAILLVLQHMSESSINGVTKTVKKLDGNTTAATFTLNSATTPTTITRTT